MDSENRSLDISHDRQPQPLREWVNRVVDIASTDSLISQKVDAVGSANASADLSQSHEVNAVVNVSTSAIASRTLKPNCIHPSMGPSRKKFEEEVLFGRFSPDWVNKNACSSSDSTHVPETNLSTPTLNVVDQQPSGETVREGSQVSGTLDLLMISKKEASRGDDSDASERLVYDHLPPRDPLRTTFIMVIHKPDGQTLNRVTKLDTGAGENVISQQVVDKLGIVVDEYTGGPLQPVGSPIFPKGQVNFGWHAAGKMKTYNTSFAVLPTSLCKDFDILLSEKEIGKIGFFNVDNTVFFFAPLD
ncbi:MAG: hypothetical protein LQ342_002220 [Letrouitia transgressa]|nr:MAG: hypothetical protein LQ342_002220 [Letrouitia transgressa]